MLARLAKGVKDGALALALRGYVNDRFAQYGEVLDCQIDTRENRLALRMLLRGETTPIELSIDPYEIERIGDDRYIRIKALGCSREWIAVALQRYLTGKAFKLPGAVATLL